MLIGGKIMLLSVDIGNSTVKFGFFSKVGITPEISFSVSSSDKRTADEYLILLRSFLFQNNIDEEISDAVIASVAPSVAISVSDAVRTLIGHEPFFITSGTHTGFRILIDDPGELGADIVSNAAAVLSIASAPIVVADLGTATTLTVINKNGELCGSVIIPGAGLSLDALSDTAELLSRVSVTHPDSLIGKNSKDSITSGIVNGNIFMIDGFIRNFREKLCEDGDKLSLVATGGYSRTIIPYCRNKFEIIDDLTLAGAALLYKRNRR